MIANPGIEKGYALDFASAIRHVATEMETARLLGGSVSVEAMATTYSHPVPGDLVRIRDHHGCASTDDAVRFLLGRAVDSLSGSVDTVADGYRLNRPLSELRYPKGSGSDRKRIQPTHDPNSRLRDPFDPMSGRFSDNIRKLTSRDSMDELRESMRTFGWIEHLPAIQDERGVVIMGHRRLAVAKELGIDPVVRTVHFGSGDAADALRFKLAIASNIGFKPLTPEDRKRIAVYLYQDQDWTMARIAEALNVTQRTISTDLESTSKSTKRGRPRTAVTIPPEDQQRILDLADQGLGREKIAAATGVGEMRVRTFLDRTRRDVPTIARCVCPTCGSAHARRES